MVKVSEQSLEDYNFKNDVEDFVTMTAHKDAQWTFKGTELLNKSGKTVGYLSMTYLEPSGWFRKPRKNIVIYTYANFKERMLSLCKKLEHQFPDANVELHILRQITKRQLDKLRKSVDFHGSADQFK